MAPTTSTEGESSSAATETRTIAVQYYAQLREDAGRSEEELQSEAKRVSGLFDELDERYDFSVSANDLRVAVNASFVDWDTSLEAGDLVVFIPPVAGG